MEKLLTLENDAFSRCLNIVDIVKDAKKTTEYNVCAFCHLPANYCNILGDLYGPYKPTYQDLVDSFDGELVQKDLNFSSKLSKENLNNSKIKIDVAKGICYLSAQNIIHHISTINKESQNRTKDSVLIQLELMQTFDYLLDNQRNNNVWNLWNKKTKIPGFTGDIIFTCNKDIEKRNIKSIETIVFLDTKIDIAKYDLKHILPHNDGNLFFKFDCKPVWIHMDCAVWTPGIFAVQQKVFGIFPVVYDAGKLICPICKNSGASIPSKTQRNNSFHFPCALATGMKFNNETYCLE